MVADFTEWTIITKTEMYFTVFFLHKISRYKVTMPPPVCKVPTDTLVFLLVLLKSVYVKLSKVPLSSLNSHYVAHYHLKSVWTFQIVSVYQSLLKWRRFLDLVIKMQHQTNTWCFTLTTSKNQTNKVWVPDQNPFFKCNSRMRVVISSLLSIGTLRFTLLVQVTLFSCKVKSVCYWKERWHVNVSFFCTMLKGTLD